MPPIQSNNKRIAKNTIALYIRMLFSMLIGLYTSRIVLQKLGVEDYGIYSVVGGIVGMFSFLNTAMAGATSRFLTFEMGRADANRLRETFSSALIIHLIIALIIFALAETVGLWIVNYKLVLPEGRLLAANIVYQCSIVGMLITIAQVPFSAVIIAHERMGVYAYVELLHVLLKLAIVFVLMIGAFDKLILYAVLMLSVSLLIAMIYVGYCLKHFRESHFKWSLKKEICRPMLSFSGLNMLSECGYSFRVYGSNIVLNTFFGTVVNAAGGIAATVQGTLLGFVANVVTAVRPQIIMSYSQGNMERMNTLLTSSIRLNLFLASLITIPMFVDAPFVLQLWLGEVPPYCVEFCRLLIFAIYITTVSQIVTIGIHASGDIKTSSLVRSILYILTPFIIYAFLRWLDTDPVAGYVIIVIIQMIACLADIFILQRNISYIRGMAIFVDYIKSVVSFAFICLALRYGSIHCSSQILQFIVNCLEEWVLIAASFWLLIFSKRERDLIKQTIGNVVKRFVK